MSRAYAFVEGQWLPCTADAFLQVQGRSEREWELILDEWREQQRQHGKKRVTVNGPLLAQFLIEAAQTEFSPHRLRFALSGFTFSRLVNLEAMRKTGSVGFQAPSRG